MPTTPSFETPDPGEYHLPPPGPQRHLPRLSRAARAHPEATRIARFGDLPSDLDDLVADAQLRRSGYRDARDSYAPRPRRRAHQSEEFDETTMPGLTSDIDFEGGSPGFVARARFQTHDNGPFEDTEESLSDENSEDAEEEEDILSQDQELDETEEEMAAPFTHVKDEGNGDDPKPGLPFNTDGLKEIGNLASWTVSTCKPGSGVEALRDEDTNQFWQSDGPQPHHLNIHFSRQVAIVCIRIYLDFEADESYTPTHLQLLAGTGYHDLIDFSDLRFAQPKGWIDVPLAGVGGGKDGNELHCFLLQLRVLENHQNGKDTHVRGIKIFARDEKEMRYNDGVGIDLSEAGIIREQAQAGTNEKRLEQKKMLRAGRIPIAEPSWLGEDEIR